MSGSVRGAARKGRPYRDSVDSDIMRETAFRIFKIGVPVAGGQSMERAAEISKQGAMNQDSGVSNKESGNRQEPGRRREADFNLSPKVEFRWEIEAGYP